jgi:hypothetical protein
MHTRAIRILSFLTLLVTIGVRAGTAAVIHVPGDSPTIQAGIDAAVVGDEVLVASGTYTGPGNRDITFGGKDIVVHSEGGAAVTIIDGNGHEGRAFYLWGSGETNAARIEGFTIRNFNLGMDRLGGGGILFYQASPTIRDCIVEDCTSYGTGGGIEVHSFAMTEISGCIIRNCRSGAGETGDAGIGGGLLLEGPILLANSEVVGNRVLYGMWGGGEGGGIYSSFDATIVDCLIAGNEAVETYSHTGSSGGGICAAYNPQIVRCRILGNIAGHGGGISTMHEATINDCLIAGNIAHSEGGGLASAEGVWVNGCTIASNNVTGGTGPVAGGGIYVTETGAAWLQRTIVWGNCSDHPGAQVRVEAGGSLTFSCSDVDTEGINSDGSVSDAGDNVLIDPLFCGPSDCNAAPTTDGEYTLHEDSPCLPDNNSCSAQIGADGEGCGIVATRRTTWGALKAAYR